MPCGNHCVYGYGLSMLFALHSDDLVADVVACVTTQITQFQSISVHCWSFPLRPCCPNVLFSFPANCKVLIWPKMYRKRHTLHLRQQKHTKTMKIDGSLMGAWNPLVKLRMSQFLGGKPWCSPALFRRFFLQTVNVFVRRKMPKSWGLDQVPS